jgi:protein-disulfide isomerase
MIKKKVKIISASIIAIIILAIQIKSYAAKQSQKHDIFANKNVSRITDRDYLKIIQVNETKDIYYSKTNKPALEIIEYGSFTCYHCAEFFQDNYDKIIAHYGDTVRFTHRSVATDKLSLAATKAIKCSRDSRENLLKYINLLYKTQSTWIIDSEEKTSAKILSLLKSAGVNTEYAKECMAQPELEMDLIHEMEFNVKNLGIKGTPMIIVGDIRINGTISFEALKNIIDFKISEIQSSETSSNADERYLSHN